MGRRNAKGSEHLRGTGRPRCLVAFLLLAVAACALFWLLPTPESLLRIAGEGVPTTQLLRDGLLAACALAAVWLAARGTLGVERSMVAEASNGDRDEAGEGGRGRAPEASVRCIVTTLVLLAVVGAAAGFALMAVTVGYGAGGHSFLLPRWGEGGATAAFLLQLLAVCLFTGIFEEAFCRVLFIGALQQSGPEAIARSPWKLALASAALFALLHLGTAMAASEAAGTPIAALLPVARFLQTAAFGFLMAELFLVTRSFWLVALAHAAFDLLLFAPAFLIMGTLPSFDEGSLGVVLLAAASAGVLAILAIFAGRKLFATASGKEVR